ncbi:hypothetical protein JX265_012605 [Neoarthrinium moseri]|uniref:AA1-like domain-containing protein n=1 Tax=Neoarthrinium moseri TaxID=1658444 RepID=A0A9Q0AII6_9PEZI|nr:uncharacterized protein JN550_010955 [Neoarthrinium moseri]KAI1842612.1 hypothetical protein JX266_011225 [Neoarthrinium moseri]KAI1853920.1 hypothetical protein JX265_012605 [Neoarthrinium moseri]KAI1861276.1 hypothetical protein JN550_010955 [Neoarthrinium moseri]
MRFFTSVAAACGTLAIASPVARDFSEEISVTDFYVHEALINGTTEATVDGVSFLLSGENATNLECSAQTGIPSEVFTCGDSKYRFALYPGESSSSGFTLRLYHELGLAVGYYGAGEVPTYCRAGGGPTLVCGQTVTPVTITIDSLPDTA